MTAAVVAFVSFLTGTVVGGRFARQFGIQERWWVRR